MVKRSGTLEWVKYEVLKENRVSKKYSFNYKLRNDTTIYYQHFTIDMPFNWLILRFDNGQDFPYCKKGDYVSFYTDNPEKTISTYLIEDIEKAPYYPEKYNIGNISFKDMRNTPRKKVILCYGLDANGTTEISAIWMYPETTFYNILHILASLLAIPIVVMLVINSGPDKEKADEEGDDKLIERADAYWSGNLFKRKRKNYKKTEELYCTLSNKSAQLQM